MTQKTNTDRPFGSYLTAKRTIFDADICTFVNVGGLHEPLFIDMEYVKTNMPPSHHRRFAPGPFLMTIAMGLVAPLLLTVLDDISKNQPIGLMKGMVNVNADIKMPGYAGDTMQVELIPRITSITKSGNVMLALQHIMRNQDDIIIVDFIETLMLGPAQKNAE
jgi:acyl dehydratase